jgi:hypothetical protein
MTSAGFDNWCALSFDRLFDRYRIAQLPLESYIASWRRRLNRIRDESTRLSKGSYLEVRYEELCREPDAVLSRICAFLGLEAPAEWLRDVGRRLEQRDRPLPCDAELLYRVDPEDLLALNQTRVGPAHPLFRFPPDAGRSSLLAEAESAGIDLRRGQAHRALETAVQIMSTTACHEDRDFMARAHRLAISASRQCGNLQVHRHWLRSAGQHGFASPDIEVTG